VTATGQIPLSLDGRAITFKACGQFRRVNGHLPLGQTRRLTPAPEIMNTRGTERG